MSFTSDQLLDKGVAYKRAGKLEEAKNCYIDAINHDPYNMITFISLGKTAHLLRDQNLAVKSYLASCHLQLSDIEKAINNNNLPMHLKFQYDSFPKNILNSLPKKSAFTIYIDPNTPRHLAHSMIDLSPGALREYPELKAYAEVYHAHISGRGNHNKVLNQYGLDPSQQISKDEEVYIPYGRDFLIKELQWNKITNKNVVDIYFSK
jgi:tetratricopeptide (TPR) repeat protein